MKVEIFRLFNDSLVCQFLACFRLLVRSVRLSVQFFCPFICFNCWFVRIGSFVRFLLSFFIYAQYLTLLLGLQTHANPHQADYKQHNTKYNVISSSDPGCKEIQGLVTEVVAAGVSVVWLLDFVNPHISKSEPGKENDLNNSLQMVHTSSFFVPVVISDTTRAEVGKDSCRSTHDQVNGNHVFHRTFILVFETF